ncbi:MAG: hypothetical protein H6677_25565 [Candidatus Obscuribacterales bacterium]|nr:hypothetical protein [Candidatus Obscuribacterales bacterium]
MSNYSQDYVQNKIEQLIAFRKVHDDTFSDSVLHQDCKQRIDHVINTLTNELEDLEGPDS